jgi:solute carrier family 25, member 33/36
MVRTILKNEGVYGLYKGYSASYYSSILYGYLYFYIYKGLKMQMKESLQPSCTSSYAMIYASASTLAEIIALIAYYPYELVKVRFLTKNDTYGYHSVSDAFVKILRKDSVPGLYRGVFAFFLTFMG